ncbi:MAG: hypothetical protein Q9M89_10570 [Persephonella sp.]|nr:hypothetical protein [Persephonella sp.]
MEELQKFYREQVGKIAFTLLFVGILVSSALFYMAEKETVGMFLLIIAIFSGIISVYKILRF